MDSSEESSGSATQPTYVDRGADLTQDLAVVQKIKVKTCKLYVNGTDKSDDTNSGTEQSKDPEELINESSSESGTLCSVDKEVEQYSKDMVQDQEPIESSVERIENVEESKQMSKPRIVPVKVSIPKMLPAKIKDNKLVMVQLVDEIGKPRKPKDNKQQNDESAETAEQLESTKGNENEDKSTLVSQRTQRSSTPMSREFMALQKSVTDSKILTEFVSDAAIIKARKRRKSSMVNKDSLSECGSSKKQLAEHLVRLSGRRKSSGSSTCRARDNISPETLRAQFLLNSTEKWSSEEKSSKRTNMRSQNTDFVQKQMHFLQKVNHQPRDENEGSDMEYEQDTDAFDDEDSYVPDMTVESNSSLNGNLAQLDEQLAAEYSLNEKPNEIDRVESHLKSIWRPPPKVGWDSFCWKCRECEDLIPCNKCIRSFHISCIKTNSSLKIDNNWICLECVNVENVLNGPKRSRRSDLPLELLSQLLSFALKRMKNVKGYSKFAMPSESASYNKYIINPANFSTLQEKIDRKVFRCAEEFVNETKWMLHNALILCRANSKEALTAKAILKICRQEANEIETCPECYLNANTRADWFVDVCAQPHLLLWAKLKGFPYWPAKAMGLGQGSLVNVRFFGEHDRAFVPVKDCFLYSEQDPNTQTGKRSARELADCIKEVEVHIENIKAKIGKFRYANYRTLYDPAEELQQLERMMPGVTEYMKKQQALVPKPSLQYKIVKTADNHLLFKKADATESGHDSDHSPMLNKKKCIDSMEADVNKAKYEVVSKANSDDSNSSKVSAVILKRKPNDSERQKSNEPELPILKVSKLEDSVEHQKLSINICKRKHRSESTGKEIEKRSKHEPKVPIITIKTNGTKDFISAKKSKDELESETQIAVDNIVKNKQNVTLKRIPRDDKTTAANVDSTYVINLPNSTDTSSVINADCSLPLDNKKKEVEKDDASNSKNTHNDTHTLTELVPFVEIKQEILSDNEEMESIGPIKSKMSTTLETIQSSDQLTSERSTSITIKQEPISDDEMQYRNEANVTSTCALEIIGSSQDIEKSIASSSSDVVRRVGDTTIQKVSSKSVNCTQQQNTQNVSPTSTFGDTSMTSSTSNKRSSARGVPYGPLPASATASRVNDNTSPIFITDMNSRPQNQQQLQPEPESHQPRQTQRARKTFPNRIMSDMGNTQPNLVISSVTTQATSLLGSSDSIANERNTFLSSESLLKTSMVAIPVDVTTNRSVSSIPVPPLTAVSKTLPTSSGAVTTSVLSSPIVVSNTTGFSGLNGVVLTPSMNMSLPPPLAGLSQQFAPIPDSSSSIALTPAMSTLNLNSMSATMKPTTTACTDSIPTADTHLLGDYVTPALASAITDVICRGPPKLATRPSGPLHSEGSILYPSQAGPVSRTLVENAHKMTDFFISVIEDTINEMSMGDDSVPQAKVTVLTLELERIKQGYENQIAELKRTSDLMLCEMRKSMEMEKSRMANEIRKQCELERLRSVEETKKKQWCANCGREAQFYCCWNTSYCDYPCQQLHWSRHSSNCTQPRPSNKERTFNQERRKSQTVNKSTMNTTSMIVTSQPKSVTSSKKDKHSHKNSNSTTITSLPAEILKLPSNTFLRPVPVGGNNNNTNSLRNGSQVTMPLEPFNMPMQKNSNATSPFTILRRNCWKAPGSSTSVNNTQTVSSNLSTSLGVASVLNQQQTQLVNSSNLSSNNGQRNIPAPANSTTIIPMPMGSNQITNSLQCNLLRSTQM